MPAVKLRLWVTARTATWTFTVVGSTAPTPVGRAKPTVTSKSDDRPSSEIGWVGAFATSARSSASPSTLTTGTDSVTRATSKPGASDPTTDGMIGREAVCRFLKTFIVTRTVAGSTSTPRTCVPSWSTGVRRRSWSTSRSPLFTGTIARTDVTRWMSDCAPRTVAVEAAATGGRIETPSGTVPGTTTMFTVRVSSFSRRMDTNAGSDEVTWIRGSADSTSTRTDWACELGVIPDRSTVALKFEGVNVTFAWSAMKYRIWFTTPIWPTTIVPLGWLPGLG